MTGTVEIHSVTRVKVTSLSGNSEEELIQSALLFSGLEKNPLYTVENLRYIVTLDDTAHALLYHDRDHLDRLHEERIDEALIFDAEEALDGAAAALLKRLEQAQNDDQQRT